MVGRLILAILVLALAGGQARAQEAVKFMARDGVTVFGDFYPAQSSRRGVILLFHQAGSNRGEYATIAPMLGKAGYDALAIDQRSGGTMWGRPNETAKALGKAAGYMDALPDLEAAVDFARKKSPGAPLLVWGSSYSSSLVFLLAAHHPEEIAALLSFSPGEYFSGVSVRESAARVKCPVFVTSASDAEEVAAAKQLLDAVPAAIKTQFVPRHGIHGSSTLRQDTNASGAAEAWAAVNAFLERVAAQTAGAK